MPASQLFIGKGRGVAVIAAVAVAASVIVASVLSDGLTSVPGDGPAPEGATSADGPLVVSSENPRFFTAGSGGKAVYLVGVNLWNNLQDGVGTGTCDDPGPLFDFREYLDFLKDHRQNFIRLWRWEHFKFRLPPGLDTGGPYCVTPHPWARTGGRTAYDGGAKFDLSRFDQAYFDRLRQRVVDAGNRGIYVSVMLFEGFCLHLCDEDTIIAGHPFDSQNNVNGIDIDSIDDYQGTSVSPTVLALQRAYIRKVIDTVQDLDNVLYEVANESYTGSVDWQYGVIEYVKQYEDDQGYEEHPVGMSAIWPDGEEEWLFDSPADWVMPGTYPPPPDYRDDPMASDGTKVVISEDDHYAPCDVDAVWAWKSLTRGLSSSQLDCGIGDPANPSSDFDHLEPARLAQGDARRQADTIDLLAMVPRGDLTSTEYALANVGEEYLVHQPADSASSFRVTLAAGTYKPKWFNIEARTWIGVPKITVVGTQTVSFTPPFASPSPSVLYLREA
jgi:Family of unknown function (DUF6298)